MFCWILSGMMIFQETDNYTMNQLIMIFASVLVCFIGIYLLYIKKK